MGKLDGQIVIVTGASAGIGEAAARRLAGEGATVVIAARRADRLEALKREIESAGGRALAGGGDVTSPQDGERLLQETVGALGRVGGLVHNTGSGRGGPIGVCPRGDHKKKFES